MDKDTLENGDVFSPRYDDKGLIPCITINAENKEVLMFAYMNKESIELSLKTGEAHYWSRSRQEIWHKGATSGMVQNIISMRTDCDQDCLIIEVEMPKDENGTVTSCHTGRTSCFYREVLLNNPGEASLKFTEDI